VYFAEGFGEGSVSGPASTSGLPGPYGQNGADGAVGAD
jgi:hypothetical protein